MNGSTAEVTCSEGKARTARVMQFFNSSESLEARLPFSDAVQVGNILYLSGVLGNVPGKSELVSGGLEAETRQAMENIEAILRQYGLSLERVFKCTVMLADISKWGDFNKVYVTYFDPGRLPARSAFGVTGLALGAEVELECWAYVGSKKA
jgi:2-iminobutanoate/2-iminopropanoate deaminase